MGPFTWFPLARSVQALPALGVRRGRPRGGRAEGPQGDLPVHLLGWSFHSRPGRQINMISSVVRRRENNLNSAGLCPQCHLQSQQKSPAWSGATRNPGSSTTCRTPRTWVSPSCHRCRGSRSRISSGSSGQGGVATADHAWRIRVPGASPGQAVDEGGGDDPSPAASGPPTARPARWLPSPCPAVGEPGWSARSVLWK